MGSGVFEEEYIGSGNLSAALMALKLDVREWWCGRPRAEGYCK